MKKESRIVQLSMLSFTGGSIIWIIFYYFGKKVDIPSLHMLVGPLLGASVGYGGLYLLQHKEWKPSIMVGGISGISFFVGYIVGQIIVQIIGGVGGYWSGATGIAGMVAGVAGTGAYCAMAKERSIAISMMLAAALGFALGMFAFVIPWEIFHFSIRIALFLVTGGAFIGVMKSYCQTSSVAQCRRCNKHLAMLLAVFVILMVFSAQIRLICHNWKSASELTTADKVYLSRQVERKKGLTGKPVPEIVTTALDESAWALSDHKGKVILLDFWATWCGPCIGALPEMKILHEKFRNRLDFLLVGISLDAERDDPARFCKNEGIDWIQLFEPGKAWRNSVAESFEVKGIPDLCLINKEGIIVGIHLSVADADRMIKELLSKK